MSMSISEAARHWEVSRATIYRKGRKGELSLIEGTRLTVESSEMRRVFGEPVDNDDGEKRAPMGEAAAHEATIRLAVMDTGHKTLKAMMDELRQASENWQHEEKTTTASLALPTRPWWRRLAG